MSRAWLIFLALAGCSQGTYVVVTVDSAMPLTGVSSLAVDLTLGTRTAHKTVQPKSAISLPATFAVEVTSGSGSLTVHVDAVDSGGITLSSGEGSVDLSAHHTVTLAIELGGGNPDLGGGGGDGNQVDASEHTDGGPAILVAAPVNVDLNPTAAAATHTRNVVVTNTGGTTSGTLVTNLSGTDVASVAFGLNGCDTHTLDPGASCTTQVNITPATPGSYSAQLTVHDDQGHQVVVPITATAVAGVQLSLAKAGNGAGDVAGIDIDCGTSCSMLYPPGTVVTLTATPDVSSNFISWSQAGCSGPTCDVTVSAATTVTATFTLKPVDVTVTVTGTGSITSTPAGISNCTSSCKGTFFYGQALTLTATPPATGYVSAWSQGCTGGSCVIMPTADTTLGATFAAQPANFVFITSTTVDPGALGGIAGATTICNMAAANGGLGGSYVPWLSSTTVDAGGATGAISMSGKRGWVRRDGLPFVDTLANLIALKMYYPLTLDESGNPASNDYMHKPVTFTSANGTKFSTTLSDSCQDWTSTANGGVTGSGYVGDVGAGGTYWTDTNYFNCKNPTALICFGINSNSAVPAPTKPAGARLMFPLNTATDSWDPAGAGSVINSTTTTTAPGLAGADSICQSVATRAGLATPTHFFAYLTPDDTLGAWTRFTPTGGGTWYRPDNVQLFAKESDFLGAFPTPQAPIDVFADGTYANGYIPFVIGSTTSGSSSANRCGNWDTDSSSTYAPGGQALETYEAFQYSSFTCGSYMGLLCVQQ